MAQFSLHAYDADVWVPEFRGLNQADVNMNPDLRYAEEEENLETPNGVLQPGADMELQPGEFSYRINSLASFYRRWYTGPGSKEWLIAGENGKLYYRQAGSDVDWTDIDLPTGITGFAQNTWSYVTYEITESGKTIDVLLVSNKRDGMFMIVPPDRPAIWADKAEYNWQWVNDFTWGQTKSARWVIRTVDTLGKKFGVIARYEERIWGGNIAGEPDMLMYSKPYNPLDWNADPDIPEDGGGDIMQPSWDGASFTSLIPFGDQLIAIKENRVWRIMGTNPGEYEMREQYGGGSVLQWTVASDGERIFMAGQDHLNIFDGMNVAPYQKEITDKIWKTINRNGIDQMMAVIYKQRYYLAFPTGNSPINNALLVYNLDNGTVLYYSDIYIEWFLATSDALYATSSSTPGKLYIVNYDSWECKKARNVPTRWVSPWMDFGYKRIQKGGFDLYFVPEVQDEAVELKFSIQTEKKLKTKKYTVQPLTEEQRAKPKEHRGKRLHFGGMGRKFRVIVETDAQAAPWRLIGGLQLVVETDPD